MVSKFQKAKEKKGGSRFLHVLAACPPGWKVPSELSVKVSRLAVQANVFPLYEVEDGIYYSLNYTGERKVKDYLELQGRFKHLTETDINRIQQQVDADWELLLKKSQ
jgi:pyruvate/2-oxoacid:ferredoxin oxidoreductase beta subunit